MAGRGTGEGRHGLDTGRWRMSYGINSISDLPEQHRTDALRQMEEEHLRPVRTPMPFAQRTEHEEQVALFQWAAINEYRWPCLRWMFAIPNGGKRDVRTAVRLRAEGVKAGVPDIFLPYPTADGWCGLWIELKHGSNKPTQEQQEWLAALALAGYRVATCWGAKEAIQIIETYLREELR